MTAHFFGAFIFPLLIAVVFTQRPETRVVVEYALEDALLNQVVDLREKLGFPMGSYSYQLVELGSIPDVFIRVENETGKVFQKSRDSFDRERICPRPEETLTELSCSRLFTILAKANPGYNRTEQKVIIKFNITIKDVNDNAPRFEEDLIEVRISEDVDYTTFSRRLKPAIDPDAGANRVSNYSISSVKSYRNGTLLQSSRNHPFYVTWRDPQLYFELKLRQPLDREQVDTYELNVTARDMDKSGSQVVRVLVGDLNDNSPIFANKSYSVSVMENHKVNTTLLRVLATDLDAGENGRVGYRFEEFVNQDVLNTLRLDSRTGAIILASPLNYYNSRENKLIFSVVASDGGQPQRSSRVDVEIDILDTNDKAPSIIISPLHERIVNGTRFAVIDENELRPIVATISATDEDSGLGGQWNCSIDNHPLFQYEDGFILGRETFDAEQNTRYQIKVRCSDHGTPTQTSSKLLHVLINDKNDNGPVFTSKSQKRGAVLENIQGHKVLHVDAVDADSGNNSRITYEIVDERGRRYFEIDREFGFVLTKTKLDRESQPRHSFRVKASDNGNPPRSNMTEIVIDVLDENDFTPKFSLDTYNFYVLEEVDGPQLAGSVEVIDMDEGENADLTLELLNSEPGGDIQHFRLHPNGSITTVGKLNRERKGVYHLEIRASDRGAPPKSSSAKINIFVNDVNDHGPTVFYPTKLNNTIYIYSNAQVGSIVCQIDADDADAEDNARLEFSIRDGSDERQMFVLDRYSGTLRVGRRLSSHDLAEYPVGIKVCDKGTPPRCDSVEMTIIVQMPPAGFFEINGQGLNDDQALLILILIVSVSIIFAVIIIIAIVITIRKRQLSPSSSLTGGGSGGSQPTKRLGPDALQLEYEIGSNGGKVPLTPHGRHGHHAMSDLHMAGVDDDQYQPDAFSQSCSRNSSAGSTANYDNQDKSKTEL